MWMSMKQFLSSCSFTQFAHPRDESWFFAHPMDMNWRHPTRLGLAFWHGQCGEGNLKCAKFGFHGSHLARFPILWDPNGPFPTKSFPIQCWWIQHISSRMRFGVWSPTLMGDTQCWVCPQGQTLPFGGSPMITGFLHLNSFCSLR